MPFLLFELERKVFQNLMKKKAGMGRMCFISIVVNLVGQSSRLSSTVIISILFVENGKFARIDRFCFREIPNQQNFQTNFSCTVRVRF